MSRRSSAIHSPGRIPVAAAKTIIRPSRGPSRSVTASTSAGLERALLGAASLRVLDALLGGVDVEHAPDDGAGEDLPQRPCRLEAVAGRDGRPPGSPSGVARRADGRQRRRLTAGSSQCSFSSVTSDAFSATGHAQEYPQRRRSRRSAGSTRCAQRRPARPARRSHRAAPALRMHSDSSTAGLPDASDAASDRPVALAQAGCVRCGRRPALTWSETPPRGAALTYRL
jgi:hypothetical protein